MQQVPPYQMSSSYQFSAQPQVIRTGQQMYRDPYKDFIKIAPQNVMFDRRVVRGNTHAAFTIPTSMQPDPVLAEKQKEQEIERNYRKERLMKKKQEEEIKRKMIQEEEEKDRIRELEHYNDWAELEDYDDIEDERKLEPDFYVDKPPTPVFMENPKGTDQEIQVEDHELFDFELEVEPILQVLVGKACENARLEVIEDWEKEQFHEHKRKFLIIKEAELMETQRMEAARNRRRREAERRYANFRTAKGQIGWANQKL
jgi:radial spoke head protein 3